MRKREELTNTNSCLNKAREDELLFVLLGRDPAAPDTIRYWIDRRIQLDRNRPGDTQVVEAESCALRMEAERVSRTETAANVRLAKAAPDLYRLVRYLGDFADRPETLIQSAAFGQSLQRARELAAQIQGPENPMGLELPPVPEIT